MAPEVVTVHELFAQARAAAEGGKASDWVAPLPLASSELRPSEGAMRAVDIPGKGRGLVAARDLKAGETLCCETPIAMVRDDDDDDDDDFCGGSASDNDDGDAAAEEAASAADNRDTGRLVILICDAVLLPAERASPKGESWRGPLAKLYPRTLAEARKLRPWECSDAAVDGLVRAKLAAVRSAAARALLPLVVRHNALDVRTNGELLSYPASADASLGGLALYGRPSLFNHDDRPNVLRWHVGAAGVWRTNRPVREGTELCISYVESDILGDDAADFRHLQLRHFEFSSGVPQSSAAAVVKERAVDADVQNELMQFYRGRQRIGAVRKLASLVSLDCDAVQIGILLALTRLELGEVAKATATWVAALGLAEKVLPPNDETLVVIAVAAARAALAACEPKMARKLLRAAARRHDTIFGGGRDLFETRLAPDVALALEGPQRNKTRIIHPDDLFALLGASSSS